MKKAFWVLALGALASAVMAASIGRAEDAPTQSPMAVHQEQNGR